MATSDQSHTGPGVPRWPPVATKFWLLIIWEEQSSYIEINGSTFLLEINMWSCRLGRDRKILTVYWGRKPCYSKFQMRYFACFLSQMFPHFFICSEQHCYWKKNCFPTRKIVSSWGKKFNDVCLLKWNLFCGNKNFLVFPTSHGLSSFFHEWIEELIVAFLVVRLCERIVPIEVKSTKFYTIIDFYMLINIR